MNTTAVLPQDELQWIAQAQQGDRQAFGELVYRYREGAINVVYRMCGDANLAEDAAQEAFIRAWQNLPRYKPRSPFRNWLYRIATNEALMFLRKKRPDQISVEQPAEDKEEQPPLEIIDWCCLPEGELMSAESRANLDANVEKLPQSLRIVFLLRDIEGLSTRETAEVLDLTETAVKTRLSRARLRLRELLSIYFSERVQRAKGRIQE